MLFVNVCNVRHSFGVTPLSIGAYRSIHELRPGFANASPSVPKPIPLCRSGLYRIVKRRPGRASSAAIATAWISATVFTRLRPRPLPGTLVALDYGVFERAVRMKRLVHLDGGDEPRQAASAVVCLQGFHFARYASRRLRLRLHKHPCRRKERARLRSEGSRYSDHGHFNALHGANTNAVQLCGFNDPRSLGERLANRRHYIRSQNARYEHFGP